MKHFILEDFLTDLEAKLSIIDIDSNSTNVNDDVKNFVATFKEILHRHAPLRPMTRSEKRLSDKPWITKGIFKSIKTRNLLFRSSFRSNDPSKKDFYKKYNYEQTYTH